jgi:hypothetical protein
MTVQGTSLQMPCSSELIGSVQVGFVVRLEGHRLTADLEDELPDFEFAFESSGALVSLTLTQLFA